MTAKFTFQHRQRLTAAWQQYFNANSQYP